MTKNDEKRVLRAISNADARQKCLLLINNITDSSMRGTPLLTTNQVSDIERIIRDSASYGDMDNFVISDEQQICAAMLDAMCQLSLCLIEVQTRSFDAKADIARLQGLFVLSLIHISEPTRLGMISYAVFCLKKKKKKIHISKYPKHTKKKNKKKKTNQTK